MLRIILISTILHIATVGNLWAQSLLKNTPESKNIKLKMSLKKLYSHKKHNNFFKEMAISCQDCHPMFLGPKVKGIPNAEDANRIQDEIKVELLKNNRKSCHKCHLGQLTNEKVKRCDLCHQDLRDITPLNHNVGWNKRHGFAAGVDSNRCLSCHQQNDCSDCHLRRDRMHRKIHNGNFRFTHSIEARANPNSCIKCHQSPSFCWDCHVGKR